MQRLCAVLILSMLVLGCDATKKPGPQSGNTTGQLYVATPSSVLRFNSALTATGNVAPVATITGLSSPQRLLLDAPDNRLFVANQGGSSILVFDSVSTLSGNITPSRIISGGATTLVAPTDLALDLPNNLLYVADGTSILVFAGASTIAGNTPPVRTISTGFTITGILLNSTSNQLFVADAVGQAVDRLDGASSQNGAAVVAGTIIGTNTALSRPNGLALDSAGRLIVSNSSAPTSLTFYANAATATGNVAPVANITGPATLLQSPGQVFFNNSLTSGELYVADKLAGSLLIFANATTASGNVAPTRNISGPSTGLAANAVNGVALDTTR